MHLERVLIVVERRIAQDGSYPGFDIRHMEGPLQSSGIVDNIDVLYYSDYTPNCDDALVDYCLQKKPQVILLSLQNISHRRRGEPTPEAVCKATYQLHIPTVAFWFDIHSDAVARVLESYLHSVTLNMILGADVSSHKSLPLKGANYIYAGVTFDERLFNISEGVRDIPVGFQGSLNRNRPQWVAGLKKLGISPYIKSGPADWTSYEDYLKLMCRLKIALNFSLLQAREVDPVVVSEKGKLADLYNYLILTFKRRFLLVTKNPAKLKDAIPAFKYTVKAIVTNPRYIVRARVWEALWCRTFLLEEDNPVTSLYFEPYVDYVPFTILKDLVDKIRYYLENEEERDRIRMQGRATVEKYHNARIYWENLFEAIGIQSDKQHQHHAGEIWNKAYFDKWYLSHPYTNYDE